MQQAAGQVIKIEQRYACNIYILYTDHSYDQFIAGNRVMFGQRSRRELCNNVQDPTEKNCLMSEVEFRLQ